MGWVEALVLGLVQGLSEFLPISSSGHLVLVPALLHWQPPGLAFVVWVHLATLLAVLVHFRTEVVRMTRAFLHSLRQPTLAVRNSDARLAWLLILGTIPGAVAGVLLHDVVSEAFEAPRLVSGFLLGTGVILLLGQWLSRGTTDLTRVTPAIALGTGIGQAVALFPGISRSGTTIASGLLLGVRRTDAARFSFLLSIPIIAGSGLMELRAVLQGTEAMAPDASWLLAFAAAAVSGYAAITIVMRTVALGRLWVFAVYCFLAGGAGLIHWAR